MHRIESLPVLLAGLLLAGAGHAQSSDPAAAQALFDDAKRLETAGNLAEACPKFLASFKLDPKPGAVMNLADCYEKNGQLASAWARFLEGAALAQRAGQAERQQFARDRAKALESKLSRLVIASAAAPAGLEVLRDGNPIDVAMLGTAVPVDSGKHEVVARAPGKKLWTVTVTVPLGGEPVRVDVPALEDAPAGEKPALAPRVSTGEVVDVQPAPFWGPQRVAGVIGGAAGLLLVGVGTGFGVSAASKWSSAKSNGHCSGTPPTCDATGAVLTSDAQTAATVSSATLLPGAVLLAAGIVVFVTAPKAKAPTSTGLRVTVGGSSLTLTGSF